MPKRPTTAGKARRRGRPPERLKLEGRWQDAVKTALKKPPPRPEKADKQ